LLGPPHIKGDQTTEFKTREFAAASYYPADEKANQMPAPGENLTMRLGDGRAVGYAQYGEPSGTVVVNAQGGLACRLDVAAADAAARAAGVRLISPDRPGIGLSDPQPGRAILDWAGDVLEVLNQLGSNSFRRWAGRWEASMPPRWHGHSPNT
jgi:hypothetical protein